MLKEVQGEAASGSESGEDSEDGEQSDAGEEGLGESVEEGEEEEQSESIGEDEEEDGEEDAESEEPLGKVRRSFVVGSALTRSQDKTGVKTKYDRMFNRKSQTILSSHYTKLIDNSDETGDSTDDFITLKRSDHTLEEENLPESAYLSKRKLKMGTSKKAMLSLRGNPTKLVFDDEGGSHPIYELAGEDDFKNDGDAREQQQAFVEAERELLKVADVEDKERAKQKRREKKRKMKEYQEEGVRLALDDAASLTLAQNAPAEIEPMSDDGYQSPRFDLSSDASDDDGAAFYNPNKAVKPKKKRRVDAPAPVAEMDLEALALRAMGKR